MRHGARLVTESTRPRGYTVRMKSLLFAAVLLLVTASLQAQVYRWVDEEGNVQFSDTPPPGDQPAETVDLPKPSTMDSYKPPAATTDTADTDTADGEKPVAYRRFSISSPPDDEALRENAGNVTITVDISPDLQPGHRLNLYLDGNLLDNGGNRSTVQLNNVPRGTHQIRAEILDGSGKVLRRTSSSFHLLRATVGRAPPPAGQPLTYPPVANTPSYPPKPAAPRYPNLPGTPGTP